mmetsp:Transcript_6266/g.16314  ORF Transcript_6266/g.16314 Transcript_6266/m.16314 type:complete len:222 (+) Transcript_6266:35-700(+)
MRGRRSCCARRRSRMGQCPCRTESPRSTPRRSRLKTPPLWISSASTNTTAMCSSTSSETARYLRPTEAHSPARTRCGPTPPRLSPRSLCRARLPWARWISRTATRIICIRTTSSATQSFRAATSSSSGARRRPSAAELLLSAAGIFYRRLISITGGRTVPARWVSSWRRWRRWTGSTKKKPRWDRKLRTRPFPSSGTPCGKATQVNGWGRARCLVRMMERW